MTQPKMTEEALRDDDPSHGQFLSRANMPGHAGVGFVLSGGAARGAYEVGVLRFILEDLAKRLGRPTWPDVVSGTSVGALNGLVVASRSQRELQRLSQIWQTMEVHDVFQFKLQFLLRRLWRELRRGVVGGEQPVSLVDSGPLVSLIQRIFPEKELRAAIDSRQTAAFMVAATDVETGFNTLFVDGHDRFPLPVQDGMRVQATRMQPKHCLASAALPLLFAPVMVDGRYYVDGGLRLNTPLLPVMSMGVQRVLVIGLQLPRQQCLSTKEETATRINPSMGFLAGKTLDALMLDPITRDVWNAERQNSILKWGNERFGKAFAEQARLELGLHPTEIVHLYPSEDLGRMAGSIFQRHPPKTSVANRRFLEFISRAIADKEADALSFFYFDKHFTREVEALGYEDARRHEEQLMTLYLP